MFRAQSIHRRHFDPNEVQISTLLSIKTGGCPEDCAYCPQSAHYDTGVKAEKLMAVDAVLAEARAAKSAGASRFCMGAAWREPKDRDSTRCARWSPASRRSGWRPARRSACSPASRRGGSRRPGLDYYNHNLDTSPEYYGAIITTRTYRSASTRSPRARRPAFTSAAAASSAWARAPRIASA